MSKKNQNSSQVTQGVFLDHHDIVLELKLAQFKNEVITPIVERHQADYASLSAQIGLLSQKVDNVSHEMNVRFNALEKNVATQFETINLRFDAIDDRFKGIDARFEAIEIRFKAVDERFKAIDRRFESIEHRLVRLESKLDTELAKRPTTDQVQLMINHAVAEIRQDMLTEEKVANIVTEVLHNDKRLLCASVSNLVAVGGLAVAVIALFFK
jgi:chromosome segregation ATPase